MGEYQYLLNPKDTLAGGGTIDFDLKGNELKEAIYANFEDLGLDGAVFTAGKSGKVPYGRLKKYYRNQDLVNAGGGNATQQDNDEEPNNKVENLQFYYHPDHLGSSSYITDVSGEVYQHMEYFPFGETFIEERTDAEYTSYLYNGKELDEETGLYYYGARYYDPRISMFYGVDPMAERYVYQSPFVYAANNPIKFIDVLGMGPGDPSVMEAALISDHVYSRSGELQGGWELAEAKMAELSKKGVKWSDDKTGFNSALYQRTVDGETSYVYATAGTDDFPDAYTDVVQALGIAEKQYARSTDNALQIRRSLGDANLTYVGHSLGGGLASANALKTGDNAITFNAAGLNSKTKSLYSLDQVTRIDAYIVIGEIVDDAQAQLGYARAEGTRHEILPRRGLGYNFNNSLYGGTQITPKMATENFSHSVQNHLMGNVIKALKESGYK